MAQENKHLYYISELSDYKISDGYPDVRGWDVKDIDNRVIGKVDNLLVNKDAARVVYLDVDVDKSIIDAKHDPYGRPTNTDLREFVNKEGENHIIIPIGLVDLNEDSNYVYTDILDHRTFSETKRYRKGDTINRQYENQVLGSYGRKEHGHETNDNLGDKLQNEHRLREIIQEEIRKYHHDSDKNTSYRDGTDKPSSEVDDALIITDEETELRRRIENDGTYDDHFYDRKEFEDRRSKKRTPGL